MPKRKIKFKKISKWLKSEKFNKNLKILALFFLGFLLGMIFKSQAFKNTVVGYDDHKILNSNEVLEKNEF